MSDGIAPRRAAAPAIAAAPPHGRRGLTLDSRAVGAGRRVRRAQGRRRARARTCRRGRRARRARGALGPGGRPRARRGRTRDSVRRGAPLRDRLGGLADRFYGSRRRGSRVAGVTGTNGKTTCAWLLASAAGRLARRGGLPRHARRGLSAGGCGRDADDARRHLAAPAAARAARTPAPATSRWRCPRTRSTSAAWTPCALRVAAFSNLTRDHLDYHGTMERYAEAKARLFRLPGLEHAVINVGDPIGQPLCSGAAGRASS